MNNNQPKPAPTEDEFPRYWIATYNTRMGLAVMRQISKSHNSQMIANFMLPENEARALASVLVTVLENQYEK